MHQLRAHAQTHSLAGFELALGLDPRDTDARDGFAEFLLVDVGAWMPLVSMVK